MSLHGTQQNWDDDDPSFEGSARALTTLVSRNVQYYCTLYRRPGAVPRFAAEARFDGPASLPFTAVDSEVRNTTPSFYQRSRLLTDNSSKTVTPEQSVEMFPQSV
ncbi:hypothetical protein VTJ49DRAFT_4734 [Mycothermus thermophilus]|uniref:Uncharacterized protein n=1 Tax=Humicola insolens TaxID=85995 RepID=A0ABR3V4T0_HUMIN